MNRPVIAVLIGRSRRLDARMLHGRIGVPAGRARF
jgi:hypothetical protein